MYKHLNDNGDINVAIDDDGNAILVCSECGHVWLGNYPPALRASAVTKRQFARLLSVNQDIVRNFKIDMGKFS